MSPSNIINFPTKRDLVRTETALSSYTIKCKPDVTADEALSSEYWVNIRSDVQVDDLVTLLSVTGRFDIMVRVVSITATSVKLRVLNDWRNPNATAQYSVDAKVEEHYIVRFNVGKRHHYIAEKSTGKVVAAPFDKESAEAECQRLNHERAVEIAKLEANKPSRAA